jgi:hypothetical protein
MNSILEKFRDWHEKQIFGFQDAMKLDDYHMYWLAFGEGIVLTLLFLWII